MAEAAVVAMATVALVRVAGAAAFFTRDLAVLA